MIGTVRVVDDVAAAFRAVLEEAAPRTLALSGGRTAVACYAPLAEDTSLDWSQVTALFSDERWVPVEHPDSNEGSARRLLLDHVAVAAVHSVRDAGPTAGAAAAAYDRLVASLGGIDLVHLGLGDDAHTASLFPGAPALAVTDRLVVAVDHHDHPRVTFTYPGIATGRLAVVTVAGAGKRGAFARVAAGDPTAPGARIDAGEVLWLVDRAAAG